MITRLLSILMWIAPVVISVIITIGNVEAVKVKERAEYDLPELDLGQVFVALDLVHPYSTELYSSCFTDWLRTQKDLRLKQLDIFYGHEALAQSQQRLLEAHRFLLRYLRCNPADGYAWLSAALIMKTMNNDDEVIMKYLSLSKFYAPRDPIAVRARQDVLQGVSARLRGEYRDLLLN